MGAQGTTTVDFGTGAADMRVTITGQGAILANSVAEAWPFPALTANNQPDDTAYEDFNVVAMNVVAGTGFDIVVQCRTGLAHGIHNIAWVWN